MEDEMLGCVTRVNNVPLEVENYPRFEKSYFERFSDRKSKVTHCMRRWVLNERTCANIEKFSEKCS